MCVCGGGEINNITSSVCACMHACIRACVCVFIRVLACLNGTWPERSAFREGERNDTNAYRSVVRLCMISITCLSRFASRS